MNAPIALFAYRRPVHLSKVISSLLSNPQACETELFVYSDAPRKPEDAILVEAVRSHVRSLSGFKKVHLIERQENYGLSRSIISGVTEILERYGCVIVLEDDLVVSPDFLAYMNRGLEMYREDVAVASIHGYCYPIRHDLPETFFIRGADCWGWATWSRAWMVFNADGKMLLKSLKERKLGRIFDFANNYPYMDMLKKQIAGKNDSWAIRWYASAFLSEMLTLYPGKSLVANIGFDGSGEHCSKDDTGLEHHSSLINTEYQRIPIQEHGDSRLLFECYFNSIRGDFLTRVKRKLKKLWRKY